MTEYIGKSRLLSEKKGKTFDLSRIKMKSVIEMVSDIRYNVVEFDDIGRGLHTVKPDCCPKKEPNFSFVPNEDKISHRNGSQY